MHLSEFLLSNLCDQPRSPNCWTETLVQASSRRKKWLIHLTEKSRIMRAPHMTGFKCLMITSRTWFPSSSCLCLPLSWLLSLASHNGPWQLQNHNLPRLSPAGLCWLTHTTLNHCSLRLILSPAWIVACTPTTKFLLFSTECVATTTDFGTRKWGTTENLLL